ncbi:MAG: tetratricopeptide repeat protein [Deltaproteobacteria bacterium]|jgi:tetratricopeptide (TPR) repeat protein|nr:tetratricopeptide repeat protein [Deltaproteobacteria bacterium]
MTKFSSLLLAIFFFSACTNNKKSDTVSTENNNPNPDALHALSKSEDSPLIKKIKQLIVKRKFAEALNLVETNLEKSKEKNQLLYLGGVAAFNQKKLAKAKKMFKQALDNGADFVDLYVNYSETLFYLKKFKLAEKKVREGLKKYPDNPALWYNLGGIYMEQGKKKDAFSYYGKSLMVDGSYAPSIIAVGSIYYQDKKTSQAVSYFKKLLSIKGFKLEGHLRLAYIYMHLQDWEKAVKHIKKTLKMDPNNIRAAQFLKVALKYQDLSFILELAAQGKCKEALKKKTEFSQKHNPSEKIIKKIKKTLKKHCK